MFANFSQEVDIFLKNSLYLKKERNQITAEEKNASNKLRTKLNHCKIDLFCECSK
jgi:hypothetical protein